MKSPATDALAAAREMNLKRVLTTTGVAAKGITDAELLAAYNSLTVDADDPAAEAITAEIQRRNLDL